MYAYLGSGEGDVEKGTGTGTGSPGPHCTGTYSGPPQLPYPKHGYEHKGNGRGELVHYPGLPISDNPELNQYQETPNPQPRTPIVR